MPTTPPFWENCGKVSGRYAVIATAARILLESGSLSGGLQAEQYIGRHAPDVQVSFVLMEHHHADLPTRQLYKRIKNTLKLPFVNTDYRALCCWPSYFSLAWQDPEQKVESDEYKRICLELHNKLTTIVQSEIPNPGKLDAKRLQSAARRDASVEKVLDVCMLFQWLLPGLITNVAYFRQQLQK